MGRTRDNNSSSLKITLAAPPGRVYAPGDTFTGTVVRRSPIVSPEATVTLWLEGRVQTEIKQGSRHSTYSACWYPMRLRTQYLFHGPLHLSRDSGDLLSWPFSADIPMKPNNHPPRGSRDHNYRNVPVLPGTSHVGYESLDSEPQGYVEYYLSANLQYTRGGRSETDLATKPIVLRNPLAEPGFGGSKTARVAEKKVEVRSQRLLPGMEHRRAGRLTIISQKTQKLFRPSKVPVVYLKVEFGCPRVIQLDNPSPLPLTLRITPRLDETSAVVRDVVHMVRLDSVNLTIRAYGCISASGDWPDDVRDQYYSREYDLGLGRAFADHLQQPVVIPCGGDAEGGFVHVGNMFQLVLRSYGLYAGGRCLGSFSGLYPDFATFNIRHGNHVLEWEICLSIAQETTKVKGSTSLKLLAAE